MKVIFCTAQMQIMQQGGGQDKYLCDNKISQDDALKNQPQNKTNPRFIISLTSYPARSEVLSYALYSVFTQSLLPDEIVLYLTKLEYPRGEADISQRILSFVKKGLKIRWTQENFKPYNKLIFALKDYPNDVIITIDDDSIYPPHWLCRLITAYHKQPHFIHAHRVIPVTLDAQYNPLPYLQWKDYLPTSRIEASYANFLLGHCGVLYPPNAFDNRIFDSKSFMQLSPHNDDIWFWAMAVLNGTKINRVDNHIEADKIKNFANAGNPLWKLNCTGGQNDIFLRNIFHAFPQLKDILKSPQT